jgi:hypothetical protein
MDKNVPADDEAQSGRAPDVGDAFELRYLRQFHDDVVAILTEGEEDSDKYPSETSTYLFGGRGVSVTKQPSDGLYLEEIRRLKGLER